MGEGEGARSNCAVPIGARVGLTGLGGVKALRDGPWVEEVGAKSGSGVPSSIPWVEGRGVWVGMRLTGSLGEIVDGLVGIGV